MYFIFKCLLLCNISLFMLLLNSSSFVKVLVILENLWVLFFCLLCFLDIYVDDSIFLCLALLCLVLAACEIITLASFYILDYNK